MYVKCIHTVFRIMKWKPQKYTQKTALNRRNFHNFLWRPFKEFARICEKFDYIVCMNSLG